MDSGHDDMARRDWTQFGDIIFTEIDFLAEELLTVGINLDMGCLTIKRAS